MRERMERRRTNTRDESNPYELPAGLAGFRDAPLWMAWVLWAAGICTVLMGTIALARPAQMADWLNIQSAGQTAFWRYLGGATAGYGIAYLLAAANPLRHWPVVFAGLCKSVVAPIALICAAGTGPFPKGLTLFVFVGDVIWWIPFCVILFRSYQSHLQACRFVSTEVEALALRARTNTGRSVLELAEHQPLMLFFLRHTGCPFCRESLARLSMLRQQMERTGTALVLIHMSSDLHARKFLSRFGLEDVPAISDPQRCLYRAFGLRRGNPWQVAGPQLWARGLRLLLRHGQNLSQKGGDLFQLSGLFLVFRGQVVRSFLHQSAGDLPDFLAFAGGRTLAQNRGLY